MTENLRVSPATGELFLPDSIRRKPKLSRVEAAQYLLLQHGLTIAASTLAKLASVGGGPPFHKAGPSPLYPKNALDAWATQRLGRLRSSTSDNSNT
jgi:hypothetical protein